MSAFKDITFSFHAGLSQYFLFTGTAENPKEIHNVTMSVQEGIIASYLVKPGVLTAPDGSQFLLELTLLPAFKEAKQRMLDEAQAKVTEANALVVPATVEDTTWMADLTNADKELMKRIVAARRNGQRVSMSYSKPFEFRVKLGPAPAKKKQIKVALTDGSTAVVEAGSEGQPMIVSRTGSVAERVPVVVLSIPESNSGTYIIERKVWDSYSLSGAVMQVGPGQDAWLEGCLKAFCIEQNIDRGDVTNVDFNQTRTREELDKLPDFQF